LIKDISEKKLLGALSILIFRFSMARFLGSLDSLSKKKMRN